MTTEKSQHPFANGPHLQAALLCERVLEERDGVKSAIRIVDRLNRTAIGPNPPPNMEPFTYELMLLIKFKSGSARGPYRIELRIQKPSGESPQPMIQTVNFEGEDDRGVDIIGNLSVQFDTPGLWWFDAYVSDIRVSRIPMRVIYLPQPMQTGGAPGGSSPEGTRGES